MKPKKLIETANVLDRRIVYPGLYLFRLSSPGIAMNAMPGQFVEVDAGKGFFLRRPFSIQDVHDNIIEILVKVVGKGTRDLVEKTDAWNLIGPLGNSFTLDKEGAKILVGGGVGTAPLKFLLKHFRMEGDDAEFLVGARTSSEIPMHKDDNIRSCIIVSTDDGSEGFHGNVVGLLDRIIEKDAKPYIYSCGPLPMLKALRGYMLEHELEGEFSLENRMACGMGVCQGCAVPVGDGFKLVCHDGPVFPYRELSERFWV